MKSKFKYFSIICLVGVLLLSGCSSKKENKAVQILVPQGAPSLALLPLYEEDNITINNVNGSDLLSGELAKENSAYDIIIAPINIGVKMMNEKASPYSLAAVITWGNLYLVANDQYQKGDAFTAFGEQAIPGKMLKTLQMDQNVSYVQSIQDVQAQLLAQKTNAGLLAEPAATATIKKAKDKGINLHAAVDLQKVYQEQKQTNQAGYPQAAIFIKEKSKTIENLLNKIASFTTQPLQEEQVKSMIETIGVEKLGIPNAEIAVKTWPKQNISYKDVDQIKAELETYLNLFQLTLEKK